MKAALARTAGSEPSSEVTRALRLYDRLLAGGAIGARTTALGDYTHTDWDRMEVYRDGDDGRPWHAAGLGPRMEVFARTARALAEDAFAADAEAPDALIQVSCTGYDAPTAAQRLAAVRGWSETRLVHLGHMGCYAALPAVALAADLVAATAHARNRVPAGGDGSPTLATSAVSAGGDGAPAEHEAPDAHAAVFLVELCTLHHHPATTDVEQLVQQVLFADGAARVDVTLRPRADGARPLALLDHFETLVPESAGEMTWRVGEPAFRMTLSREVPRHLRERLGSVVGGFLARHGLSVADVPVWAVHPGGPRIIESTAEALGLPDEAVRHSRAVLHARGNMSSATLPHIWHALATDAGVPTGTLVVSLAFGPGLTVAGNLLRVGA